MFNSTNIAVKIIEYAKSKGISQAYICDQLSLHRSYLLNVKRGKDRMTPDRLAKIAEILHTTPEYLMDETDNPDIPAAEPSALSLDDLPSEKQSIIRLIMSIDDPHTLHAIKLLLDEIRGTD